MMSLILMSRMRRREEDARIGAWMRSVWGCFGGDRSWKVDMSGLCYVWVVIDLLAYCDASTEHPETVKDLQFLKKRWLYWAKSENKTIYERLVVTSETWENPTSLELERVASYKCVEVDKPNEWQIEINTINCWIVSIRESTTYWND